MYDERKSKEFNKALHDFAFDVAGGAAIRHLANLGYSVSEIKKRLDFPISEKQIGQAVWKHLIDTRVICLENPSEININEKVTYVSCKGEYGRTYFKRVTEKIDSGEYKYIECNFGKLRYRDRVGFDEKVSELDIADQEYIRYLPWPLNTVWHREDDRIVRIVTKLTDNVNAMDYYE